MYEGYTKYKHLLFEYKNDGILLLTINRAEQYNTMNALLHRELSRVWLDIGDDPDTRVVVVTGAGKAFCAGGELSKTESEFGKYDKIDIAYKESSDLVYNMINLDKPIISAINGAAAGGGLAVALLADISVIAEEARLTDAHMRIGIGAGDHAAILWPLLSSMAKVKYYLLTADLIDGREAERIGLVTKCVPLDQLMNETMRIATKLGTGPQSALRWTKRSLNGWLRQAGAIFDASLANEILNLFSPDAAEGVRARQEKRDPIFPSTL